MLTWSSRGRTRTISTLLWGMAIATKLCYSTSRNEERRKTPIPRAFHSRDSRCEITFLHPVVSPALIPTTNGVIPLVFRVRPTSLHLSRKERGEERESGLRDFTVLRVRIRANLISSCLPSNVHLDNHHGRRGDERLIRTDGNKLIAGRFIFANRSRRSANSAPRAWSRGNITRD